MQKLEYIPELMLHLIEEIQVEEIQVVEVQVVEVQVVEAQVNPEKVIMEKKKKPVFIKTIKTEQELNKIEIKKIKKHGTHYHIYDRDNKEFITYLPLGEIGEKWHIFY